MIWKESESYQDDIDMQSDFLQEVQEEDQTVESILQEFCRNKLVPIYSRPLEETEYLGKGKIVSGPEHVNGLGDAKIGYCKIRFYDKNQVAGHWVSMKYLKSELKQSKNVYIKG